MYFLGRKRLERNAETTKDHSPVITNETFFLTLTTCLLAFSFIGRKLDFQGDRIREGFKGRVPGGNEVGPL